jgi:hypothetical protein
MLCVLTHDVSQMALTERDDLRETFRLDRSNETLCIGIQIRAASRQLDRLDTRAPERGSKRAREERIPIVNQLLTADEEPLFSVRQVSRDLAHPAVCRNGRIRSHGASL